MEHRRGFVELVEQVDRGLGVSAMSSGEVYVTGFASDGTATVFAADGSTTEDWGCLCHVIWRGLCDWTGSDGCLCHVIWRGHVTGFALGTATVFAAGSNDAFVVKYASDGTPTWVRRIGGAGDDRGLGVSAMSSGEVYVTGTSGATVFAADGSTTAFSLANAGSSDAFVVKYASDGTPIWVRRIAGIGNDQGLGVSAMSTGEVYVSGIANAALITNFL
jgi:hypothetical protein